MKKTQAFFNSPPRRSHSLTRPPPAAHSSTAATMGGLAVSKVQKPTAGSASAAACDQKTYQGYHMIVPATSMPEMAVWIFVPGLPPHGARKQKGGVRAGRAVRRCAHVLLTSVP